MKVRAFFVIKGKSRLCHCEVAARACTPKWLSIEKTFLPGRRFGTQAWQSQEFPRFALYPMRCRALLGTRLRFTRNDNFLNWDLGARFVKKSRTL